MANFVAGSVSVLVRPSLQNFHKDIKKELAGSGMQAVGRDIAEDIVKPLQKETSEGAKQTHQNIEKELGKSVDAPDVDTSDMESQGTEGGNGFSVALLGALKKAKIPVVAAVVAIGAAAAAGFAKGIESNTNTGQLMASLGLNEADARAAGRKAGESYRKGFGESKEEVTQTLTFATQITTGDTDADAQRITELAETLNASFGYDTEESIRTVDRMIKNGLVGSWEEGFDLIAKATQDGMNVQGDLLDSLNEYSADFSKLGLTGDEALGLINQGMDAGAWNTDRMADGMREFYAQITSGSPEVHQALTDLGFDADQVIADISAGGPEGKAAFDSVTRAIDGTDSAAKRAEYARTFFGTMGEENTAGLLAMDLDTASESMDGYAGSTQQAADDLVSMQSPLETLRRELSGFGPWVGGIFAPLTKAANQGVIDFFDWIRDEAIPGITSTDAWKTAAAGLQETMRQWDEFTVWFGDEIVPRLEDVWGSIKDILGDFWTGTIEPLIEDLSGAGTDLYNAMAGLFGWEKITEDNPEAGISTIFAGLRGVTEGFVGFLENWVVPGIKLAMDAIGWLFELVVGYVTLGLDILTGFFNWITLTLIPGLQTAWDNIKQGLTWLYENVILPVWDAIRIAIAIAVGIIMSVIEGLIWLWENALAPALTWLYEQVVLPIWNAIRSAIDTVVQWFKNTAWPLISLVIDWLRSKFETFKNGLKAIWDFIKNKIIAPVVNWFRDVIWPRISSVIDKVKGGFQSLSDKLRDVWNTIRYTVIEPVVNWFETNVLDRITSFTDKVKEAFQGMKDGVGKAFEQVKDKVRGPVEWLIDTVVNDSIIDNINSVLSTFGMEDKHIGAVSLPAGFATGGYTGPGSKYTPAGIVHADEYVIRKESQRSLRRAAPGFLDSLNKYGAGALGYATGGLVSLGPAFTGSGRRGDGYGARGGKHKGIDWALPHGTALIATADGTAVRSYNSAAGNKLTLSHGNGIATTYHHLSGYAVPTGARVNKGQVIGYVGSTGRSSGPHLHLGVQKDGTYVNPDPYLTGMGEAGSGGFWNPFAGLWDELKGKISDKVGDSVFGEMLGGMPKFLIDKATGWVSDTMASIGDWATDTVDMAGGIARWTPVATEALAREGQLGPYRLRSLLRRMEQESSFNPNAVNNWDSNAAMGQSSRGLMQVIPSTFEAYRDKSLGNDIFDPLQNIVASIRYTLARYGSLQKGWDRPGGYAEGGLVKPYLHDNGGYLQPGLSLISNKTRKPEAILSDRQWDIAYKAMNRESDGRTINITQHIRDTSATAGHIASEIDWGLRRAEIRNRV